MVCKSFLIETVYVEKKPHFIFRHAPFTHQIHTMRKRPKTSHQSVAPIIITKDIVPKKIELVKKPAVKSNIKSSLRVLSFP